MRVEYSAGERGAKEGHQSVCGASSSGDAAATPLFDGASVERDAGVCNEHCGSVYVRRRETTESEGRARKGIAWGVNSVDKYVLVLLYNS